jgi:aspartate/methionine/tyrosine aminotransferase
MKQDPDAPFARRMGLVEASGIRAMFDLAQKARREGRLLDFSIGQPDFHAPPAALRAAARAATEGFDRYTSTQGLPELLDALRANLEKTRPVDGLLVTSGASGGLVLTILALVDPGDEVLVTDPFFVSYKHLVRLAGGTPVFLDTYATGFKVTPAILERHRTKRTKLLIFNNPVNPTGAAYAPAEVRALAAWARRHGIVVLADEVYDRFCFDFPFEPFARHHDRTVTVGAFSKTYGMPGWRIGWLAGPKAWVERMMALQQYTFVCAPALVQRAALAALGVDMTKRIAPYRRKRDLVHALLARSFEVVKPQGAFYVFPRAPQEGGKAFATRAIGAGVLVVPGGAFSLRDTHVRISYAAPDAMIRKGMDALCRLADAKQG